MVPRADDEISAANVQLELLNMAKSGQLIQIWQSASTTHVQFNLVSQRPLLPGPRSAWGKLSREPQPPSPPPPPPPSHGGGRSWLALNQPSRF